MSFLVKAFNELGKEFLGMCTLVVCGKIDPNYPEIADSVTTEQKGNIIATGRIPESDLRALYSGASCFVNPSLVEGFGLTYLEAQSSRIPVLASDIPVAREVLSDSAMFFNPNERRDFVDKLTNILQSENQRRDLVLKGVKNLERFSWQKVAQETERIYQEILSK